MCNSNVYGLTVLKNKYFNEIKTNGVGGMQKWPVSSLSSPGCAESYPRT